MLRRTFLALSAAATLLPLAARAEPVIYEPGVVQERLAAGETLFVDFYADWCVTCAAQHRVLDKLTAENPAYEQAITFVQVDWDTYGRSDLARGLSIPRRSTLVVLKGNDELGRIVAGTAESEIRALLDTALAAAGAS
ncbi:thioredoxin family protein [Pseudoroseicyclus sp. H15]